jgi:hypothetical protein
VSANLLEKWKMSKMMSADPNVKPAGVEVGLCLLHHHNTKSGQCNPSYARIAEWTGLNRDTVIKGVQSLEAAGYLAVDRSIGSGDQASKGQRLPSNSFKFDFTKINQSEIPTTPGRKSRPPQSEKTTTPVDNSDHPQSEKQTTGGRKSRPKQEKEEQGKIEQGNRTPPAEDTPSLPMDLSVVEPKAKAQRTKKAKISKEVLEPEFQTFMRQYPRPDDEDEARRAYFSTRRSGRATAPELLNGACRYAAEKIGVDPQFIKAPQNWLKHGSWKNPSRALHLGAGNHHDQQLAQVAGFLPRRSA